MATSIKTRVMDFVASKGGVTTFSEVQRFIVEQVRGWKYDTSHRGYFSSAFTSLDWCWYTGKVTRQLGYFRKPGIEKRYLQKQRDGKYYLVNPTR
jgi:hypothetical protein